MPDKAAPAAHIAILDDDPDQLLALSKWLVEAGYTTSTFDRGGALLKFLKTPGANGDANADAALVDWGLPDMAGVEVIRRMRDDLRLDIPIILVTSRNAEQDIVDAGKQLVTRHPDVGAIVLECTNMPPYAAALQAAVGLPVYDIYSMITWFHAGLRPRVFG